VSSWASPLEDWFDKSNLSLVNPTGLATRQGKARQCDSIIDLALLNDSALCTGRFSPVSVSFPDSLGSDHAALSITWSPPFEPLPYVPTLLPGFVIDNSLVASWTKDLSPYLRLLSLTSPPLPAPQMPSTQTFMPSWGSCSNAGTRQTSGASDGGTYTVRPPSLLSPPSEASPQRCHQGPQTDHLQGQVQLVQ